MRIEEMKIEDAIQQKKPFGSAKQKAIVNLIYTHNWVTDQIRQYLKPYGITMKQYNVLRILQGAGEPITTSTIRERLLDKMSDASRMVDRMHQKGLVIRNTCSGDKRLVDVVLSKDGEQLMERLAQFSTATESIVEELTEEEAEQLSTLLDKLRK